MTVGADPYTVGPDQGAGVERDLRVQREALDVAAQLARQEERLVGLVAAAAVLDRRAALGAECHATLDRGRAGFGVQPFVGFALRIR